MTPQERKLIEGVGQRLRGANLTEKDAEAESLIKQEIEAQPDSTYVLTQAVILQEHALKIAQSQIQDLQKEVEQARQAGGSAGQQAAGSSFLGGLFGGGGQQPRTSGTRAGARAASRDPWGGRGPAGSPQQAAPPGGGFGGFMKSAAAMAVGVAGGALLAGAIQDMFQDEGEGADELAEEATVDEGDTMQDEAFADAEEPASDFNEIDEDFDTADSSGSDFDFGDDDWS